MSEESEADRVPEPAPPATTRRFCGRCGRPLTSFGDLCDACPRTTAIPAISAASEIDHRRSVRSVIWLYCAFLASTVTVNATQWFGDDESHFVNAILIQEVLTAVIVALFVRRWWKEISPSLRIPHGWWPWGVAVIVPIFTFSIASALDNLARQVIGLGPPDMAKSYLLAGYGYPVLILSLCVQPALVEEAAFRGVMQTLLRGALGRRDTVLVVAFMFALVHLSLLGIPQLVLIGLTLGVMREWTGSILPGVLAHFLHNLLSVVSQM